MRQISEVDNNEIHQAYQRAIKEKELIELENSSLKQELSRISRLVPSHSRSISNASSVNNEEDFGYGSAKNTLENKKNSTMLTPPTHHNNHNATSTISNPSLDSSNEHATPPDSFTKQRKWILYIFVIEFNNYIQFSCQFFDAKTIWHGTND